MDSQTGLELIVRKKNPIKNKKLPKVIVAHVLKGHGKEKIFPINLEIFLLPFVF